MTPPDAPLPLRVRAGFGSGQIAGQIFRDTPSLLLLFFLTTVMGVQPALAGAAIFFPKVFWGVLSDLGVGLVSDRIAHRFPRRRWLLLGAVLAPLAMVLIFHIPQVTTTLRVAYVFAAFCFYMLAFATFSVPYLSQFSQITRDPAERTALLAWRHTFTGVGLLVGSSLTPALIGILGGGLAAYHQTSWALAAVCAASLLTAYLSTPKAVAAAPSGMAFSLSAIPRVFNYKPFRTLASVEFIQTIGAGLSYASIAYFLTYNMNRSDALVQLGGVSLLMATIVIFGSPIWVMVAKAFGKKRTYVAAAALHACVQFAWGLSASAPLPVIYVYAGLIGFLNAGWGIMSLTMLADMIARSAEETGENRAGSFSAVWALIEKVGIALGGTLVAGFVLSAFGFRPATAGHHQIQTQHALTGIVLVFAYAPALFNLTAALVFWKWGRSPEDHGARPNPGDEPRQPMSLELSQSETRPVGIAVIGCGRISAAHLDAIRALPDLARLAAVVDADLTRAQETASRYGAPHAFDTLDAVFQLEDVEAVLICTPNDLHAAQTLSALAAGRHVLVEKPMAENGADAIRMADAADRAGLVLAIGHTFRHSAPIRHLLDNAGSFGALRAIEVSTCVHWDGPQAPWWKDRTPEQGLILSLFAPHALDFVQLFMGDDPIRVHVEAARHQTGWQGEDEAMILLRYPNQRMASIHLSYNQAFVVDRKTLHFEKAMVRIEDGEVLWVNGDCLIQPQANDEAAKRRMGGRDLSPYFESQLQEFVHAVQGVNSRSVLQHEGRRLIQLIDKVLQAGRIDQ